MKRVLIFIQIIALSMSLGFTQIVYEGKHDANLKVFQAENGSLKFYKVDSKNKKLLIFNDNNILWKSIDLKTPKGHLIDNLNIINTTSTEENDQIRVLFTCYYKGTYAIEDVSEFFSKQEFMLNIIDDEGNFLLQIPEATDYKLFTTNGINKLLVYKTDRKGFKSNRRIEIYGF